MADETIPDVYVDQMRITVGVFGVNITFGLSEPHPAQGGVPRASDEKVRVRMSLEHAKIAAMLLRRQVKQYERESGTTIAIPQNVYGGLGVPEEDW
jgi:hypothetical protein